MISSDSTDLLDQFVGQDINTVIEQY